MSTSEKPAETSFAGSAPSEATPSEAPTESPSPAPAATDLPSESTPGTTIKPEASMPTSQDSDINISPGTPDAPATDEVGAQPQDSSLPDAGPAIQAADMAPDPLPVTVHHGKKKGLILGLIIAAIVLLLSGGAAASYYYVVNKPENVLKQALGNFIDAEKAKTVQFSGTISASDKESDMSLEATYKGAADNKTGVFELSGKADVLVTNVAFDLRSPEGKSYFVRVGGLDGLSELLAATGDLGALYAPMIASVNDQWIEINESLMKQLDESYKSGVTTAADNKKIADAYLKYPFMAVQESLADEVISGKSSHHYKVVIDKAKLKAFFKALKDSNLDSYKFAQADLDEINKMADETDFAKYPFEVWISKSDKMFTQLAFKGSQDGTDFSLRITADSYNKPVNVEKPEGAKSVLDLMGEFSGAIQSGSQLLMPAENEQMGESADGISL